MFRVDYEGLLSGKMGAARAKFGSPGNAAEKSPSEERGLARGEEPSANKEMIYDDYSPGRS